MKERASTMASARSLFILQSFLFLFVGFVLLSLLYFDDQSSQLTISGNYLVEFSSDFFGDEKNARAAFSLISIFCIGFGILELILLGSTMIYRKE